MFLPCTTPGARLGALARHLASGPRGSILPPVLPHELVLNQSSPFEDKNLFELDTVLRECVQRYSGAWPAAHLTQVGALAGAAASVQLATTANTVTPVLKINDRFGNRVDQITFHPAYHDIMRMGLENHCASYAWRNMHERAPHVARSAIGFLLYQMEGGTQCPQTMTFACVPVLQRLSAASRARCDWVALACSSQYDSRDIPAPQKKGATIGMSMTERQGGSDVRANTTVAAPCDASVTGPGAGYFLQGHKWFTSAPMCDAFLTLAQTPKGLSCFLVPRWIPHTGERNRGLRFLRLKEKLGDKSNASSEVEYHSAWGELVGEEGRGIQEILVMVHHTRLDCLVGSAALMRRCVAEACHHTRNRAAFGHTLSTLPLMKNVLADMAVESEAATLLAFRIAATYSPDASEHERLFGRIATPIAKYFICKRAPGLAYEAMECFGGNGYIEEGPMPRLFRQAPLNSIWEGSGNVICQDVLRSAGSHPAAVAALFREISIGADNDARLAAFVAPLQAEFQELATTPASARFVVGKLAVALQASLMLQFAAPASAEAFLSSRLLPAVRGDYGMLPATTDFDAILERALPF